MSKPIPKSVWNGSFTLLGVEMKCHVLDDGTRIIEEQSVADFLQAMENATPQQTEKLKTEAKEFARFLHAKNVTNK